jgi:Putative  PD-(D/E)XK family member, (DUF4420)
MTINELDELWHDLIPATGSEFSGKRLPGLPAGMPVYAALDSFGRRHLLVEVPQDTAPIDMRSTHGLSVTTDELRVRNYAGATYIDLECLQDNYHRTFTALACDLLGTLGKTADRKNAVAACLGRWRSFWLVNPAGLSREQALGLFGEIWFLARWLNPITEAKLASWQGPYAARHDFQSKEASVEVKTAATGPSSPPIHFISNIDQLADPESGQLYLFSLHVTDDALASNDLPSLVELTTSLLSPNDYLLDIFSKKLADAGYSPAHAGYYRRPLRIIAEELYHIGTGFPRLTAESFKVALPDGIESISYCLRMTACGAWRTAASPTDPAAQALFAKFAIGLTAAQTGS